MSTTWLKLAWPSAETAAGYSEPQRACLELGLGLGGGAGATVLESLVPSMKAKDSHQGKDDGEECEGEATQREGQCHGQVSQGE